METGSLEPWERYRVLTDLLDHYQDIAAKYVTLHRLYSGLMVLVFLTAGLVAFLAFGRLRQ